MTKPSQDYRFLFSVDVEDVTWSGSGGSKRASRVPKMTVRYLDFLRRHDGKGTFFVTGEVARAHPDLVRRILAEGHEVACHSDRHRPLDRLGQEGFRKDCARARAALAAAGARDIAGYRAPYFSLTDKTSWAHAILAEQGFAYSSSVLPARSLLYGWAAFGEAPRVVDGVTELPMGLFSSWWLPVPTGGTYMRLLPSFLVNRSLKAKGQAGFAVPGYFHPYDVDAEKDGSVRNGFTKASLFNWLMHCGRKGLMNKLERLAQIGFRFEPYGTYAFALREKVSAKGIT